MNDAHDPFDTVDAHADELDTLHAPIALDVQEAEDASAEDDFDFDFDDDFAAEFADEWEPVGGTAADVEVGDDGQLNFIVDLPAELD
jgi:hypothetical protein